MISKVTEGKVEKSEMFEEQKFKIEASAKAFEILSSGLYSNKILAIIRELSCNAWDAQVASNNLTTPFLIHLPNQLEPHFAIRDYGTGLSKEDILNIYTSYFTSTKTTSNDFVGTLGLGSKSPFSYTDSFSVTSFFNGKKYVYNAFKNEQNLPSIVMMGEENTTEPNGLEVMFSVKRQDFYQFINEAQNVFQYFKLQPKIVGATITPIVVEYFLTRSDWGVRTHAYGTYGAKAIMGSVAYPISDFPDTLTNTERTILGLNIDINFKIGDLDISASREKLSYDITTKNNIKKKVAEIAKDIVSEIELKISTCKTLWEAKVMMYTLKRGDYKALSTLLDYTEFKWNNIVVAHANNNYTDYIKCSDLNNKIEIQQFMEHHTRSSLQGTSNVPVTPTVQFMIKDIHKLVIPRLDKFYYDNRDTTGNGVQIILIKELEAGGIEEFKKFIGMKGDEVFPLVSTLPYDTNYTKSSGTYNPKSRTSILKYNNVNAGHDSRKHSIGWDIVEVDIKAGGIYVPIDGYKIDGRRSRDYIRSRQTLLDLCGVSLPEIYGVKPKELYQIRTNAKWISLEDYTKKTIGDYVSKHNVNESIMFNKALNDIPDYTQSKIKNFICASGKTVFNSDKVVTEFVGKVDKHINTNKEVVENIMKINNYIANRNWNWKVIANTDTDKETITKYREEVVSVLDHVVNKYPLLSMINDLHMGKKAVEQYVELVNKN